MTIIRVVEGESFVSDSPHVELIERSGSGTLEFEILSVLGADTSDTPESCYHRALPHLSIWEFFSQFRAIFVGLLVPFISL